VHRKSSIINLLYSERFFYFCTGLIMNTAPPHPHPTPKKLAR
jgi:hypothetical protein